ncbi:MAG: DUF4412 domain-containing protein [Woeseia sp.]
MKRIELTTVCALLIAFSPAFAGTVLELETTEYRGGQRLSGTVEISTRDGMSRVEVSAGDGSETSSIIFRNDKRELTALDHEQREYYVLDEATIEQMGSRLSGAMQQMQDALADLPPDQRAMAERMMKQRLPEAAAEPIRPPTTLHSTGNRDEASGYDCQWHEVHQQGRKIRDLCVTDWDNIEGGRDAADSMLSMAGFFEDMAAAFSGSSGIDLFGGQKEMFRNMRELDGYPVVTREYDASGKLESESRLVSSSTEDLDADLFEPPQDYRRQKLGD